MSQQAHCCRVDDHTLLPACLHHALFRRSLADVMDIKQQCPADLQAITRELFKLYSTALGCVFTPESQYTRLSGVLSYFLEKPKTQTANMESKQVFLVGLYWSSSCAAHLKYRKLSENSIYYRGLSEPSLSTGHTTPTVFTSTVNKQQPGPSNKSHETA